MHLNRFKYSLPEYRDILEQRNKFFYLHLIDREKKTEIIIKPQTKSLWHPKFTKAYLTPRAIRIIDQVEKSQYYFCTLTYWTKLYSAERVAYRHKKDWKKFAREVRKLYPDFQYSYFIELTKKNYIHYHFITDCTITEKEMRKIWRAITGTWKIEIKPIETKKQVEYVAWYCTIKEKNTESKETFIWSHISRLFGQSRNFFDDKPISEKRMKLLYMIYIRNDILRDHMKKNSMKENQITPAKDFWNAVKSGEFYVDINYSGTILNIQ